MNEHPCVLTQPLTIPVFSSESETLAKIIASKKEQKLGQWMKLSPKLAAQTHERFQQLADNKAQEKAAIFSYSGEVYTGLNASSFDKKDLEFAQDHIRILSGLYGLLRPLDAIYPYRLEMGITKINIKIPNLYSYWADKIARSLEVDMKTGNHNCLINLASDEYFTCIDKYFSLPVIQVRFNEYREGKLRFVSTFAKKARGLMGQFIIKAKLKKPADLKSFDLEGYKFDASLSDKSNLMLRDELSIKMPILI